MNFDDAIKAHAAWKLRIALLNEGTLREAPPDPTIVAKSDQCELGKWLIGEAKVKYAADPDYAKLVALHADFHKEAAALIKRISFGKLPDSEIANSKYAALSGQIIGQLMQMKRKFAA